MKQTAQHARLGHVHCGTVFKGAESQSVSVENSQGILAQDLGRKTNKARLNVRLGSA